MEYPLVTNAIPLFRSERFVDIIVENVRAIHYPNVEILISDRHQYDDAIDVLEELLKDDPRITFLKAQDELSYAQHYNMLLDTGHGKYFRWMPHDDSYPVCSLTQKVQILEAHPHVILVNGPWKKIFADGAISDQMFPRQDPPDLWTYENSIGIAFGDHAFHAFKGLFRRDVVLEKDIRLFDTRYVIAPERCWEFAMSLTGAFYCYSDFQYRKRFYSGSTQDTWIKTRTLIDYLSKCIFVLRYQWMLDRRPLRVLTLFLMMGPLTLRQFFMNPSCPTGVRKIAKAFPGRFLKSWFRSVLSQL